MSVWVAGFIVVGQGNDNYPVKLLKKGLEDALVLELSLKKKHKIQKVE